MYKQPIDILIMLGKRRMKELSLKLGRTHPRVLHCSEWLDKQIYKAQKKAFTSFTQELVQFSYTELAIAN